MKIDDIYIVYGLGNEYKPELWKNIKNKPEDWNNKPKSGTGLWASPINSEWGWKDWCNSEQWYLPGGLKTSFKFKLKEGAKVYVIDSRKSLDIIPYTRKRTDLYTSYTIDFEKMAKEYDAILLTENGLYETREGIFGLNTYGWDCESILILNNEKIEEVK